MLVCIQIQMFNAFFFCASKISLTRKVTFNGTFIPHQSDHTNYLQRLDGSSHECHEHDRHGAEGQRCCCSRKTMLKIALNRWLHSSIYKNRISLQRNVTAMYKLGSGIRS